MKSTFIKLGFCISIVAVISANKTWGAEFGYNPGDDEKCAVWWTEAAANEYESVELVLFPHENIQGLKIKTGDLVSGSGEIIPAAKITVRKVEYVHVIRPTDDYGKPGWYPDQLPRLEDPVNLEKNMNHPFYITIKVPAGTGAGNYTGSVELLSGEWNKKIPFSLQVWDFEIPERPSIRSAFGINTNAIREYHNLESDQELKEVTDKYYSMMQDYKIEPTSPFSLYPMEVTVNGLNWEGGIFTDETVYDGGKSLKIVDDDVEGNIEASTRTLIEVDPTQNYVLSWQVKTALPEQKYCMLLKCYDAERNLMLFENRMEEFTGNDKWKADTLKIRPFQKNIKYVSVHLFPVFRNHNGSYTGTAWFDDVSFNNSRGGANLVDQGNFEVDPEDLDINVDFTEFDIAGKKYLDGLGFNAYNLPLEGLPSGSFYQQREGLFFGFPQGTIEYDYLMKKYLTIVQDHLEEMGWLGRDYVYWFDEPNTENYPFVREGMEIIHRSAPKITRFITEHRPGPDIMDVSEISCTVIGQLDPDVIADLVAKGREFWSYVCCCPKAPYLSLFIDHDAINMRMWLWLSYKYEMKGILVWSANYWNSSTASPENYLQNPWEDPMSYTVGYGLPSGKQNGWGNGDGRFFYPPNRDPNNHSKKFLEGPVPCLRLENIRDGIEDYEFLLLLEKEIKNPTGKNRKKIREAQKLLALPASLVTGPTDYNKDPQALIQYRIKVGELLHAMNKNQ